MNTLDRPPNFVLLIATLLIFVASCGWPFLAKAHRPIPESEVYILAFKDKDLQSCYADSYRDLDSRLIVNHDYSQMASNFKQAINLRFSEYSSSNPKSKGKKYQNLDLQSKDRLVTALAGISCNYVVHNQNDKALDELAPIARLLLAEDSSDFSEAVVALGFIEGKKGKYKQAIEIFDKNIRETGSRYRKYVAEALYGRALARFEIIKDKPNNSEKLIEEAKRDLISLSESPEFEKFPFQLETYLTLGRISLIESYSSEDNPSFIQSAIDLFAQAVTSNNPSYHIVDAYDGLGLAYVAAKDYDSAIESFRNAMKRTGLHCEFPSIYLHLGKALVQKGEYLEGAKQCLLSKQLNGPEIISLEADNCISEYYIHLGNQPEKDINLEVKNLLNIECGTVNKPKKLV